MRDYSDTSQILYYLYSILRDYTDEEEGHFISQLQISRILREKYDVDPDRKTIKKQLENLVDLSDTEDSGIEIRQIPGQHGGYQMLSRPFEVSEVKLLVDMVQSSHSITKKQNKRLIEKLLKLASKKQSAEIYEQSSHLYCPKSDDEAVFYNIDRILSAISQGKKLRFRYYHWNEKKRLVMTKNKKTGYKADPFAMVYNDGFYYMISYSAETEEHIKTYRVDKMQKVEILDEETEKQPLPKDYLKNLKKRSFGMFTGHDRTVTLSCDKSKAGIIIDRFGKDISLFLAPDSPDQINATVTVTVSRQFYGWLFGAGIRISEPQDVKDDYVEYLREILDENEK
jgi:predicted DNA-binding transcriptional regulator YafY